MRKEEFLNELRNKLVVLPKEEVDDRISFYSEMIDDRVDEGKSEEEAINEIGGVDKVVNEIAKETSFMTLMKEKAKGKRALKTWEIILICAGFPFWFPIAITIVILALVAYLLLWVLVIVCYVVETALGVSSVGGLIVFFAYIFTGQFNLIPLAVSIMSTGAAILLFFGCAGATKGTIKLSKAIFTKIKAAIIRKGSK